MCFGGGGKDPQILADKPEAIDPTQTKPEINDGEGEQKSKRQGRSALRIDLNPSVNRQTAGTGTSTGLNVG